MPLQNRVMPDGQIVAIAARGLFMGNRGGKLHTSAKQLGARRWASKTWICCRTSFRDRHREVMGPSYTELFFLDEATALAAGHRPCFECRRGDAHRFAELWNSMRGRTGRARAAEMDAILHAERVGGFRASYRGSALDNLPNGAFVARKGRHYLKWRDQLLPWSPYGYRPAVASADTGAFDLLTPPTIVAVLHAGYAPVVHGSAERQNERQIDLGLGGEGDERRFSPRPPGGPTR